ncbi:MAG TPA: response regulator transcription factor [Mycobacteriales bacterium]|nr:response regulator transcription factor [Mycobacteriales bacterium]
MTGSEQRVILVDDSPDLRLLITLAIEDSAQGTVVAEADDGDTGLRLIQRLRPDVAIIDVHMPRMSGVELIRRLRVHGLTLRIIAHSNDEDGLDAALAAGADLAVMKTPNSSGLLTALAS